MAVIQDGCVMNKSLAMLGKNQAWLEQKLAEHRLRESEVFLMLRYISRMPHELPESALKLRPQRFMYGLLIFLKLGTLYRYILSLCLSQIFLPYLIQHRYGGGLDAPVLIQPST